MRRCFYRFGSAVLGEASLDCLSGHARLAEHLGSTKYLTDKYLRTFVPSYLILLAPTPGEDESPYS